MENQQAPSLGGKIKEWVLVFIVVSAIATVGNVVGYGGTIARSIPGMLIFSTIAVISYILGEVIPVKIPVVIYVSIIAMVIALPFSPISEFVIYWSEQVNLMALTTPILAYAGVVIGRDWKEFTKVGWRGLLVSLMVVIGTYLVSGGIAEILSQLFY